MHFSRIPSVRTALVAVTLALLPAAGFAQLNFIATSTDTWGGDKLGVQVSAYFQAGPSAGTSFLTFDIKNLSDGLNNGAPDYASGTLTDFGFNFNAALFAVPTGGAFSAIVIAGSDSQLNFGTVFDANVDGVRMDVSSLSDSPTTHNGLEAGSTVQFKFEVVGVHNNTSLAAFFSGNEGQSNEVGQDFYFRMKGVGATAIQTADSSKFFYSTEPIPEPSTYGMFAAAGLAGMVAFRRRQAKR